MTYFQATPGNRFDGQYQAGACWTQQIVTWERQQRDGQRLTLTPDI